jgi:hypothetical protein
LRLGEDESISRSQLSCMEGSAIGRAG